MGLIRYSKPAIVVNISNKSFGGTTVMRQVRFDNMNYDQGGANAGLPGFFGNAIPGSVVLNCTIMLFAVGEAGAYGESLHGKAGFSNYQQRLVADNTTLVHADTVEGEYQAGQLIGNSSLETDAEAFKPGGALDNDIPYMYEYEFFRQIADNVPVVVDQLITQTIQNADARGIF